MRTWVGGLRRRRRRVCEVCLDHVRVVKRGRVSLCWPCTVPLYLHGKVALHYFYLPSVSFAL